MFAPFSIDSRLQRRVLPEGNEPSSTTGDDRFVGEAIAAKICAAFCRGTSEIRNRDKTRKTSRCGSSSPVSGAAGGADWADLRGFAVISAENL